MIPIGEIRIRPDTDKILGEIRDSINQLHPRAVDMVDDVADIFKSYFEAYTPIGETHDLYDKIIVDFAPGPLGREIRSDSDHFHIVVEPTQAHTICPKNAQSLYWEELGHPLPIGRCVQHPGTPGNDYPSLAYMDGIGQAEQTVEGYLDKFME